MFNICAALIACQIKDLTLEEGIWWSCINWKYIIYWAIFFLYKTPLKHKNDNMTVSVNIITTLHSYILQWILVYNEWLFRLHLYLFLPLLPFVCLFFFSSPSPPVFVCWRHWSAETLFDSCQSTITWMSQIRLSTIQLDTDCICLGHLATILIANQKQKLFLWNFLKTFLHSLFTPLFSLKCTPHLPQCWATCILETTVIAKSTLGKGKCTQVFRHFWQALY